MLGWKRVWLWRIFLEVKQRRFDNSFNIRSRKSADNSQSLSSRLRAQLSGVSINHGRLEEGKLREVKEISRKNRFEFCSCWISTCKVLVGTCMLRRTGAQQMFVENTPLTIRLQYKVINIRQVLGTLEGCPWKHCLSTTPHSFWWPFSRAHCCYQQPQSCIAAGSASACEDLGKTRSLSSSKVCRDFHHYKQSSVKAVIKPHGWTGW